jgi:hypothetical protein
MESSMNKRTILALTFAPAVLLAVATNSAFAVKTGGCTPPTGDIKDIISIDMNLGGNKSRVSGPYCSAVAKAEKAIASSRLTARDKQVAVAKLGQLQQLVALNAGNPTAARKVSGSVGCHGTVKTGSNGTTATGTCGFTINF